MSLVLTISIHPLRSVTHGCRKALNTAFGTKAHPIHLKSPLGKEAILIIESDISITIRYSD
jgi:hypothetical protein